MTRRSLMRQQAGASGRLQALILIVFLGLGGIAGVRLLRRAVDTRSQCAGEQISTFEPGAGRCGDGAEGTPPSNEAAAAEQGRAAASAGCGGGSDGPTPRREGDPTLDQALADPRVRAELERAWNESNPDAAEVPNGQDGSQKHEQGGWIVWNRETGQYEFVRWDEGTRDSSTPTDRPPDNDEQIVIAWYHTHPNTDAEGYVADPSPADVTFTNDHAHVPGIVETHDGRKIIPYGGGGGGGGSFGGRPGANGNNFLPLAALLLLAALRRLRRALSAAMVKVVPLRGEVNMFRRRSLCLGLLLCAVAPVAVLGCRQERPSEMANTGALPAEEQRLIDKAAEDHVVQKKGWQPGEFRLEPHGLSKDGTAAVVWAVHSADERSPKLGGGKSLVLHVDRKSHVVIKELHFQ